MTDPLAETQVQEPPDELLDTLVGGKYRVVRRIGKGGFGAVYEVRHSDLNKRFAMKVLLPELSQRADVVRRFRNEALAASAIGNEHIVEVVDIGLLPSKAHYLLLEFLDGEDFAHLIEREGPLSLGRTARIVTELCEGLAAAHAKGIVHRDLKPENIFLLQRKRSPDFVKILDFGISKFSEGAGGIAGLETDTNAILGTPYFMSPEQLNSSKHVDARADLYSVGVILFRALTGALPFTGVSFGAIVLEVMTQPIPDVRTLRPDLPEALTGIVSRLLAKSRDDRTPDCETLISELEPFLGLDAAPSVAPSRASIAFDATLAPADATSPATPRAPLASAAAALEDSTSATSLASAPRPKPSRAAVVAASATVGLVVTLSAVAALRERTPSPPVADDGRRAIEGQSASDATPAAVDDAAAVAAPVAQQEGDAGLARRAAAPARNTARSAATNGARVGASTATSATSGNANASATSGSGNANATPSTVVVPGSGETSTPRATVTRPAPVEDPEDLPPSNMGAHKATRT
jgi:serine/threonine protein kinase